MCDVCVCAVIDDNLTSLQRYNSTPQLLDDSRQSSNVAPEVTSPNAGEVRSLRDVMMTSQVGGGSHEWPTTGGAQLRATRNVLGGSTGNLLDMTGDRRASKAPPPPPVRGISTLSSSADQSLQRMSRHVNGRQTEAPLRPTEESPIFDYRGRGYEHANSRPGRQNDVESTTTTRLSKRFGSVDNLAGGGGSCGQTVIVGGEAGDDGRRNDGRLQSAKRFGSENDLLSESMASASSRQRVLSDDLPPPPSPATLSATPLNQVSLPLFSSINQSIALNRVSYIND